MFADNDNSQVIWLCGRSIERGWQRTNIAQALGLTQSWVSRVLKKYCQDGKAAFGWCKPTGPACHLTQEQITQLIQEVNKAADHRIEDYERTVSSSVSWLNIANRQIMLQRIQLKDKT